MLTTALILAAALNLEPARAGMTAVILAGPSPIRRLAAFLCGIYVSGLVVGILVLFVFHHALVGRTQIQTGKLQIGIGLAAIVIAVLLASNIKLPQRRGRSPIADVVTTDNDDTHTEIARAGLVTKLLAHSTRISKNSLVWVPFVMGLACSLPSVDFMALLLLIAASGAPAAVQVGTLVMFLTVGSLATVLPLVCYSVAPAATLRRVNQFQAWVRSRTRRDVAVLVAALGVLIVVTGAMSL